MTRIVVSVDGLPRAQPRGRHVPAGKGKFRVAAVTDKGIKLYIAQVEKACRAAVARIGADQVPTGVVRTELTVFMPTQRAERWGRLHGNKPDKDNLEKLWLDCAKRAGLLPKDDGRVADGRAVKVWAQTGGAVFWLEPAGEVYQEDDEDDLGAEPIV